MTSRNTLFVALALSVAFSRSQKISFSVCRPQREKEVAFSLS
jgi:hypothetical protein